MGHRAKRRLLFFALLFSAVALFSQDTGSEIIPDIGQGQSTEQPQSDTDSRQQPETKPTDLAKVLRELSARLRSEATGWREDSEALLTLVAALQASLSEAEAERTFLMQLLTKLTALQASSKAAHAQEIAAIRAALEGEILRIEGERDKARRAAQVWKAAAFIAGGVAIGLLISFFF